MGNMARHADSSPFGIGGRGESSSTSGIGVNGYTPATTGNTFGIYGTSYSFGGTGVRGYAPYRGVSGYAFAAAIPTSSRSAKIMLGFPNSRESPSARSILLNPETSRWRTEF